MEKENWVDEPEEKQACKTWGDADVSREGGLQRDSDQTGSAQIHNIWGVTRVRHGVIPGVLCFIQLLQQ